MPRLALIAVSAVALVVASFVPAAAACKPPKKNYRGKCLYPEKIKKLKRKAGGGKKRCPKGQKRTGDTGGNCCWKGQAWNGSRCVGIPVKCPKGHRRDVQGQRCVHKSCDVPGKNPTAMNRLRCCWSGQVWGKGSKRCVGIPTSCPGYHDVRGEECVFNAARKRAAEQARKRAAEQARQRLESSRRSKANGIIGTWHTGSTQWKFKLASGSVKRNGMVCGSFKWWADLQRDGRLIVAWSKTAACSPAIKFAKRFSYSLSGKQLVLSPRPGVKTSYLKRGPVPPKVSPRGAGTTWYSDYESYVRRRGFTFTKVRANNATDRCTVKLSLNFAAPTKNAYRFRAKVIFKGGAWVQTKIFRNTVRGKRRYRESIRTVRCWASKKTYRVKSLKVSACKGSSCTPPAVY